MSLIRNLVTARNSHSAENPANPLTGDTLLDLFGGSKSDAGVAVTPASAVRHSAVYRCANIIAAGVSGLPLHTYKKGSKTELESGLLEDPHPDEPMSELVFAWVWSMMFRGHAYAERVKARNGDDLELWPLSPDGVDLQTVKSTRANPQGKLFVVNTVDGVKEWTSEQVFHVPMPGGLSILEAAKQSIGLGLAAEKFGALFYANGSLMQGFLSTDKDLTNEQAEDAQERWKKKKTGLDKAHEVVVTGSGLKFIPVSLSPADAQFIETRKFSINDIARFWGVPPHKIGDLERSTSWGTGIEQQNIEYVQHTLGFWLGRLEKRITKHLLPSDRYARFKVEGLLRGDSKSRAEFYRTLAGIKAMTPNEIRELEDLPPVPWGNDPIETPNNTAEGDPADDKGS